MKPTTQHHPGDMLLQEVVEPLGITAGELATRLGVSAEYLSAVIEGSDSVSADLANRLEENGISTARFWNALQAKYNEEQGSS